MSYVSQNDLRVAAVWKDEMDRLRQRVAELEAENHAIDGQMIKLRLDVAIDGKDAERYRWLRKQHWNYSDLVVVTHPRQNVKLGSDCPCADRLDAAIDAAMENAPNP